MNKISKVDFSKLLPYIPEKGIPYVKKWLSPYWFHLTIKKPRNSKLGDYRLPKKDKPHKITINAEMGHSLCFLTLTHEIAHLIAFNKYSRNILPHGKEWKSIFSEMIIESLDVYENELKILLTNYTKNPKASFYADKNLSEYFIKKQNPNALLVKDLKIGTLFEINNKFFYVIEKIKTRYICIEKKSNKKYYIAGNASVRVINL